MLAEAIERNIRAFVNDRGGSVPVEVTGIDLSGEPSVTVRPLVKTRVRELNGQVTDYDPLEIYSVPYQFPSSGSFAVFMPPEVGQHGVLVSTEVEVSEIEGGTNVAQRSHDRSSGVFIPTGKLGSGNNFASNAGWAEIRSKGARVAISEDTVHVQSGNVNFTLNSSGFDINVGGVSLVDALKEISDHLGVLEDLPGHPTRQTRKIDDFVAQTAPTRSESGVR